MPVTVSPTRHVSLLIDNTHYDVVLSSDTCVLLTFLSAMSIRSSHVAKVRIIFPRPRITE